MKVYVVVSGMYADYQIQAIYAERWLAEKLVTKLQEKYSWLEAVEIEEYNLNPMVQDIVNG